MTFPTTAGTAGQVLTSVGGGATPMTWTTPSTGSGTVSPGTVNDLAVYTASTTVGPIATANNGILATNGSGVPGISTTIPFTVPVSTGGTGGTTFTLNGVVYGNGTSPLSATAQGGSNSVLAANNGAPFFTGGPNLDAVNLVGTSSGTITMIAPGSAFSSWDFTLPTTAGTVGQPLISGGGGGTPMSWGALSGTSGTFATFAGSFTSGDILSINGAGDIFDVGYPPFDIVGIEENTSTANARILSGGNSQFTTGGVVILSLFTFQSANITNTGATTAQIDANPAAPVLKNSPSGLVPLTGGEWAGNNTYTLVWDGTEFILMNPTKNAPVVYGTDGGTANAHTISASNYVLANNTIVATTATSTNTGATTVNVNGTGAFNVFVETPSGPSALVGGEWASGNSILLLWDGTQFQLLNPPSQTTTTTYASAGTFSQTIPNAVHSWMACAWGGGGGGGTGANTSGSAIGGGAGGGGGQRYCSPWYPNKGNLSITVGAGGTNSGTASASGGNGGNSTVSISGNTYVVATGGNGGAGGSGGAGGTGGSGGGYGLLTDSTNSSIRIGGNAISIGPYTSGASNINAEMGGGSGATGGSAGGVGANGGTSQYGAGGGGGGGSVLISAASSGGAGGNVNVLQTASVSGGGGGAGGTSCGNGSNGSSQPTSATGGTGGGGGAACALGSIASGGGGNGGAPGGGGGGSGANVISGPVVAGGLGAAGQVIILTQ